MESLGKFLPGLRGRNFPFPFPVSLCSAISSSTPGSVCFLFFLDSQIPEGRRHCWIVCLLSARYCLWPSRFLVIDRLSLYLKCTEETFQKQLAFSDESFVSQHGLILSAGERAQFGREVRFTRIHTAIFVLRLNETFGST